MRRFDVIFEGFVVSLGADGAPGEPGEGLQDHLSDVMDALINLDPQSDPLVSMEPSPEHADGVGVEVDVTVSAPQPDEAVVKGFSLIRTAVHTAGGFTPGWTIDWLRVEANPSEVADAADPKASGAELVDA